MKSAYSIIIPVYNEISLIPKLLSDLKKYHLNGHEIIIIDDGSNDGSSRLLSNCNFIKLIVNKINKGKGYAIREGLKIAKNEKIVLFDGDNELNPNQIHKIMILNKKNNIKCVLGNRKADEKTKSFWDIGNYFLTKLFNIFNDSDLKDALCCAKSFFKSDLNINELKSSKFDIDVEIASKLIAINENITTIDLKYVRRKKNQGKKLKIIDSFYIIIRMLK